MPTQNITLERLDASDFIAFGGDSRSEFARIGTSWLLLFLFVLVGRLLEEEERRLSARSGHSIDRKRSLGMHPFFFALRTGWLAQDRFMGKVLDEWITDTQEFV